MMSDFDESYWSQRYQQQQTGWDLGQVSPPLKAYADQLPDKDIAILIPGSGNGYEAAYLYNAGFKKVYILDISAVPLHKFAANFPDFPDNQLLHQDFFGFEGSFDLILEQTFFCALPPSLRTQYADKVLSLLRPGGKLAGVLFDDPLYDDHPPFGGNRDEYLGYFAPRFIIRTFDRCYNSVPPRAGRELFMILEKPST
jgi:thiopurine S-methyltransferase